MLRGRGPRGAEVGGDRQSVAGPPGRLAPLTALLFFWGTWFILAAFARTEKIPPIHRRRFFEATWFMPGSKSAVRGVEGAEAFGYAPTRYKGNVEIAPGDDPGVHGDGHLVVAGCFAAGGYGVVGGTLAVGDTLTARAGLSVRGSADFGGGLSVDGAARASGDVIAQGDVIARGDISAVGIAADGVLSGGEVRASGPLKGESLVVSKEATIIGALTANQTSVSALAVGGGLTAEALEVGGLSVSADGAVKASKGLIVDAGGLAVQEGANVTGGLTADSFSAGSLSVGTLAAGGLIVAPDGRIVAGKHLSAADGAEVGKGLTVSSGGLSIEGGDLDLSGALRVGGRATVADALAVGGAASVGGALAADGGLTVAGGLTADGAVTVKGPLVAESDFILAGGFSPATLEVTGGATVKGPFRAEGAASVGELGCVGALRAAALEARRLTLADPDGEDAVLDLAGDLNAAGTILAAGGFVAEGPARFLDEVETSSSLIVRGGLAVEGGLTTEDSPEGAAFVSRAPAIFTKGAQVGEALAVTGSAEIEGDLTVGGHLNLLYLRSEYVSLPDNSPTPIKLAKSGKQGAFFFVVRGAAGDGAAAVFSCASAVDGEAGHVQRLSGAPAPKGEVIDARWNAGSNIELFHSKVRDGGDGSLLTYSVTIIAA